MKSINTTAVITGIRAKVDKSLGLSVSTPELTTQEKALFMELQGINVELFIKPMDQEVKIEDYKIDKEINAKTPGQRLRAVIWKYWEQEGQQGEFDDFYKVKMDALIEFVKSKLD